MKRVMNCVPVLSITGSDGVGGAGIQADIKTISALGGYAATAITSVTVQNTFGIQEVFDLPADNIRKQIEAVMDDLHPEVVKVGMVRNRETAISIVRLLDLYKPKHVVLDPGIVSAHGKQLVEKSLLQDIRKALFPQSSILCLKREAIEHLLGTTINSLEEGVAAAQELLKEGNNAVLLLGGDFGNGAITDILVESGGKEPTFYSTLGVIDRNSHGVGGVLSSAIATYLAQGNNLHEAIEKARNYVNRLVIYSIDLHLGQGGSLLHHTNQSHVTPHKLELYNSLMKEIVQHFKQHNDVSFYAERLNVTTRYLAQITRKVAGKTPKELLSEQLMREIELQLTNSDKNIQEIAYEYGFHSQAQFAKFFKQMKGTSPTEFKKRALKNK